MQTRILNSGLDVPSRNDSPHLEHVAHLKPGIRPMPARLYVITPIFNPHGYRVRYELYRPFAKHVEESGATLITIELAVRDRPFEVTEAGNPNHIQLRTEHTLWYKEPLINIALRQLPVDWEYVAWVDADIKFVRDDWAQETIRLLQHYKLIQMWSQIQDVSPDYELLYARHPYVNSFMHNYHNDIVPTVQIKSPPSPHTEHPYPMPAATVNHTIKAKNWYGPPGLAWAARRDAIEALGGIIDWGIVGSGDSYMAAALIGGVEYQLRKDFHPNYIRKFMAWQDRAERYIRRNVGYMPGVCIHYWHGKKVHRQYVSRNEILSENQFDPDYDMIRDSQGLYQLVDHGDERSIKLRDDLRRYFNQRNEDSIDL
jgi:hypothetical protein